jgi:multiple sugar transport system substrate-binding protein
MKHLLGTALATVLALAPTLAAAERLVIAGRDGGFGAALAMAVEEFSATRPGLEVERLELSGSALLDSVTLAMREGSASYDVIMLDDPWAPQFMSRGWLANLDELGGGVDEDFIAAGRDVSRYPVGTGPFYAVPFVGNVSMFAYNEAIFAQNGLSAPQSWTDVVNAARTISEAGGPSGVVMRGMRGNPIVTGFMPILWAHGTDVIDADGQASLDNEAALAALNVWLELAQYAPRGIETYNATEVRDALQQGTTAMSIEIWPSWVPSLDDPAVSTVVGQVQVMPAPGEIAGPAPMLGAWLLAVPAASENQELAREFIDFVTSPEMQRRIALEIGNPPTRASVYADPELVATYRWYPQQQAALEAARPRPRTERWAQIETILGDYLQLALIGDMEPAAALAEANERIADALAR